MKFPESIAASVADKSMPLSPSTASKLTLGGEPTYVPDRSERPRVEHHRARPDEAPLRLRARRRAHRADCCRMRSRSTRPANTTRAKSTRAGRSISSGTATARRSFPPLAEPRSPISGALAPSRKPRFFPRSDSRPTGCAASIRSSRDAPSWVLPLDHDGKRFRSANWKLGTRFELLRAEGPAGLRLPLAAVPAGVSRRALTLEMRDGKLHVFLPPLLQGLPRAARSRRHRSENCENRAADFGRLRAVR